MDDAELDDLLMQPTLESEIPQPSVVGIEVTGHPVLLEPPQVRELQLDLLRAEPECVHIALAPPSIVVAQFADSHTDCLFTTVQPCQLVIHQEERQIEHDEVVTSCGVTTAAEVSPISEVDHFVFTIASTGTSK